MHLTRRALLLALGGLGLTACRPKSNGSVPPTPADSAALDRALTAERRLLDEYDAAIARLDAVAAIPLVRARARHAVHVTALTAARRRPSPAASNSPPAPTTHADLRIALLHSVEALQAAAVTAVQGATAALLASVAAEHAADAANRADT